MLVTQLNLNHKPGKQYTQSYNAEHQLTQVELWNDQTLLATWNFFYDGDGNPSTGSGQAG